MESINIDPSNSEYQENEVIESTKDEFKIDDEIFNLIIELNSDNKIYFKLINSNVISLYYYMNVYNYEDIIQLLNLDKEHYKNLKTIFKFLNTALLKKKLNIIKNKNIYIIKIIRVIDFDEFEIELQLNKMKLSDDEMFKILINEIKSLKKGSYNDYINEIKNGIKEYENKINRLENKIKKLEKIIKENDYNKGENGQVINNKDNFKGNPKNLEFKYELTNQRSNTGNLYNFDVFVGLKDKIEYLIYNNKNNNNIDIMRIDNKQIIKSLQGHHAPTLVIRYYKRTEDIDYILSIDEQNEVIIWAIQKDYSKIYDKIMIDVNSLIYDAILLFNINNNDYLLVSSCSPNEYCLLYNLNKYFKLEKTLYSTGKNQTYYLIPWIYNNIYYIIELCNLKISITNIFEDRQYAELKSSPDGHHASGYLYNNNYLCVVDTNNHFIRIWDLVNKSIYKQISYDANQGCQIIPWNYKYTIIGCRACIIIIDINEEKVVKKINFNNNDCLFAGIKKIHLNKYGECLIGSSSFNSIKLFVIQDD